MAQAKTRQPQGPATGKSQASAKANRAKAKPAATRPVKPLRTLNKTKTHRIRNFIYAVIAFIFALAALLGTVTHILPEELQALPYMPIVVSLVPWFTLLAVIALVCAIVSKRTVSIVMAVLAIALQAFWQYPFFYQPSKLPRAAVAAASGETVNTDDGYARLMTCNVYKGRADAREIVDLVRSEHVEVLALQETTDAFVDDLNRAGIASYLPYAQVSSSDGVYGNGLWSASPLDDPSDDDVDSSASFMPGGTVTFGGGKAALVLEDPEHVLDSGIEIKVQPPGKALSTLSLMSGGEMAFVAIALYFAILKVRPTPFCVMDEIEAALDEANVTRYVQYMRRLAKNTQFLVITHRRGTMEEADHLFGVTMQEKGVSRVIELSLDEAAKTIS